MRLPTSRTILAPALLLPVVLASGCTAASGGAPPLSGTTSAASSAAPTPSSTVVHDPGPQALLYQMSDEYGADRNFVAQRNGADSQLITTGSNLNDMHPDWSPDGTQVTWVGEAPGDKDIWVSRADGAQARRLYEGPPGLPWMENPAWSHDGRTILATAYEFEPTNVVSTRTALVAIDVVSGNGRVLSTPRTRVSGRHDGTGAES